MYMYVYVCIYTCMCMCVYIYTACMYMYMYIYRCDPLLLSPPQHPDIQGYQAHTAHQDSCQHQTTQRRPYYDTNCVCVCVCVCTCAHAMLVNSLTAGSCVPSCTHYYLRWANSLLTTRSSTVSDWYDVGPTPISRNILVMSTDLHSITVKATVLS